MKAKALPRRGKKVSIDKAFRKLRPALGPNGAVDEMNKALLRDDKRQVAAQNIGQTQAHAPAGASPRGSRRDLAGWVGAHRNARDHQEGERQA